MTLLTLALALTLIAVLVLAAGCAPFLAPPDAVYEAHDGTPTIDVCIDDDFDADDFGTATDAVEAWNDALRGAIHLRSREANFVHSLAGCGIGIARVHSSMPWVALQPSYDLAYTQDGRWISVVVDRRPDMRRMVIEHEIGHALGLPHARTGLMRPAHRHGGARVSTTDAVHAAYAWGVK